MEWTFSLPASYAGHPSSIPLDFLPSLHRQYCGVFPSYEEHLMHLDQVLQAVKEARIMLSPKKCHFAYTLILLLGQKVSRLGLLTHAEKVKAITELATPGGVNVHTF